MSSLDKVLRLAAGETPDEDPGAAYVRAAAKDLDELALLLADTDDDGDGEDDDEDDEDEGDDDSPKGKGKQAFKKKSRGKMAKCSALVQEAIVALSHLQGGEALPQPAEAEPDAAIVVRLASGKYTSRVPASVLTPMDHGPHNGEHSHPHRSSHVVDGPHWHNRDSRHTGDAY